MDWNGELLNGLVAPGIASFTSAAIPDMAGRYPEAEFWVLNHFLNGTLRASWGEGTRQLVVAYLRRAGHAHKAYNEARQRTLSYLHELNPNNPPIGRYYDAVAKWETFAIDMTIAMDLYKKINGGVGSFEKNDGSKENRLYEMGNKAKHLPSDVLTAGNTVPIWLDKMGLKSVNLTVTFDEAGTVLGDVCALAEQLQDPISFRDSTAASEACGALD
jgi:hypothetical protein